MRKRLEIEYCRHVEASRVATEPERVAVIPYTLVLLVAEDKLALHRDERGHRIGNTCPQVVLARPAVCVSVFRFVFVVSIVILANK